MPELPIPAGGSPAPRQKLKRVTLLLETSTRARNRFGADFYSQVLWLRLDGLRIDEIAAKLSCCADLVSDAIDCWQAQVQIKEGDEWSPAARNPRRWKRWTDPKN